METLYPQYCNAATGNPFVHLGGQLSQTLSHSYYDQPVDLSDFLDKFHDDVSLSPDSAFSSSDPTSVYSDSDMPDDVLDFVVDYTIGDNCLQKTQDFVASMSWNSYSTPVQQSVNGGNARTDRRRQINREASRRYRLKTKVKTHQDKSELVDVIKAYKKSKAAYEKVQQAFDVLHDVVYNLLSLNS